MKKLKLCSAVLLFSALLANAAEADGVGTKHCPAFRPKEKVRMGKGMTGIYSDELPRRIERNVRRDIMSLFCRSYYFEYRKGTRLIPPELQETIRGIFRKHGWTQPVEFDEYVDTYQWD